MEKFPENLPENNEKKEEKPSPLHMRLLIALGSVLRELEPVFNAVGVNTGRELKADQEKITADYESFEKLSNETGEFFSELIPKGLRKPCEGREASPTSVVYSSLAQANRDVSRNLDRSGMSKREYREHKSKVLEHSLFGERTSFEGKLKESVKGYKVAQEYECAILQGNGVNLIRERVVNFLDKKSGRNNTEANLILQNIETGLALSLDSLLPSGWDFVPASLYSVIKESTGSTNDLSDFIRSDFERSSRFASITNGPDKKTHFEKKVSYGDLSQKGKILSLLHEIAHAWQSEFSTYDLNGKPSGRGVFETLYEDVEQNFSRFSILFGKENKSDEKYKNELDLVLQELRALGVEPYYDGVNNDFGTENPIIEEGVVNIKANGWFFVEPKKIYFPVRSESLTKALDGWVLEERDAWAHALKVMRFLRTKGIDIEPELIDLEEIKKIIDPCLESYQRSLEYDMGEGDNAQFLRKPRTQNG